jgi:hypothetical protein
MPAYSRWTYVHHPRELQPGDLVDISDTPLPCAAAADRIGECADDVESDSDCGDCTVVIFFVESAEVPPWHVNDSDEIYARLLADATETDIEAESAAHAADAAASYADRCAAAAARAAQFEVVGAGQ